MLYTSQLFRRNRYETDEERVCLVHGLCFTGIMYIRGGGCKQGAGPAPAVKPSVPVTITYDKETLTVTTKDGTVTPGTTVQSGTQIVVTPADGNPVLFLTANGLPVAYTGNAATITLSDASSAVEFKVAKRQVLDTAPEQYKVRLLFAGEKNIPVSKNENHDYYTMLKGWFDKGTSTRKADFQLENSGSGVFQLENIATKDFADTQYASTFARNPHAAVVVLGYEELKDDSFDKEVFTAWYAGILSGYGRVRTGATVVTVSLPPLSVFDDVQESRWNDVDGAIRTASEITGATLVDLTALYDKYPAMGIDLDLAKRHITEEIFLAFYSKIEAQAGNPADMMIDGKPITTTPRQKWSHTDDGNQDTVKKTLIETIDSKEKSLWPQVIFTGDSITDFFDGTYDSEASKNKITSINMTSWWNENVGWGNDNREPVSNTPAAIYRALNLGNSGDFTQSLLFRWQNLSDKQGSGAYTGAFNFKETVKAVVLMIGTNNIGPSTMNSIGGREQERPISSVQTVEGIKAVIDVLKNGFPNAKIILMGVLPRGTGTLTPDMDFIRLQVLSVNRQLENLYGKGQDSQVRLLNLYEDFIDSLGTEKTGSFPGLGSVVTCNNLFFDTVHPNNAGYKIWWDNLTPIFADLGIK